jgi:hypothetical protein
MPIPASRRRPQGRREPITAGVKHQPRPTCQASAETGHRVKSRRREQFLHVVKGGSLRSPPTARLRAAASGRPRRPPRGPRWPRATLRTAAPLSARPARAATNRAGSLRRPAPVKGTASRLGARGPDGPQLTPLACSAGGRGMSELCPEQWPERLSFGTCGGVDGGHGICHDHHNLSLGGQRHGGPFAQDPRRGQPHGGHAATP